MQTKRPLALLSFVLLWAAATAWNFGAFDSKEARKRRLSPDLVALPRPEVARTISLGFDAFLADLYWIRGVNYFGQPRNQSVAYGDLPNYINLVIELAPDFRYAYTFAGMAIPFNRGDRWVNVEPTVRILNKGIERFPREVFLRILLAYNYSAFLKQYDKAAEHLAAAARVPGAPYYVGPLAAKMLAVTGDFDRASLLASELFESTDDPTMREMLAMRAAEVAVERDLVALERAVAQFKDAQGSLPGSLNELVAKGILASIPVEPLGGTYQYDPKSGQVSSSTLSERLRIHSK